MKMYNKAGDEAYVEKDQVKLMEESGWSKTKPKAAPEVPAKIVKDSDEEDDDKKEETPTGILKSGGKLIKKTSKE